MSRRGEVPFVAVRVGRSNDPKEVLGLAAELRIPRAHALGFLVLWEEMILEVGDAKTGKIAGYTAAHIAAKLGWEGKAARLIAALKNAGVIASHRETWRHPYWLESITGQYANSRAEQREEWARAKRERRAAEAELRKGEGGGERPVDVQGDVSKTSDGRPTDVSERTDIKKERKDSPGQPPPPPASAGGAEGASRWEWLRDNHPRPRNPGGCAKILGGLSADEWAMVQWLATQSSIGGGSLSLSRKRLVRMDTYRILQTGAYLEILPEWRKKLARDAAPKPTPDEVKAKRAAPAVEAARHRAAGLVFLLAQLADKDVSEAKKEQLRKRWRDNNDGDEPWLVAPPPTEGPSTSAEAAQ